MSKIQYVLNTTPEYRRARLKFVAALQAYTDAREELGKLREACDHQAAHMVGHIDPLGERAVCEKCEKHLGWWCPDSPKHFCEYDEAEDPCRDNCDYCGNPEERK
jgi:hypothetical protein